MNWSDFNTYGSLASIAGIIVSFLAFCSAYKAKNIAKNIQKRFSFDKRIPEHLKSLDVMIKDYNILIPNFNANHANIHISLSQFKSELISLYEKTENKNVSKLIKSTIKKINKRTTKLKGDNVEDYLWDIYTDLNEIHHLINNIKKDSKYILK